MTEQPSVRKLAVQVLMNIYRDGASMSRALPQFNKPLRTNDKSLLQEMCYGTVRFFYALQAIQKQLLAKPLKNKDRDIEILILLGLYQLMYMRIPQHAVVQETVRVTKTLKKNWAKGLVNAVLRRFIREKTQILERLKDDEAYIYAFPEWLLAKARLDWPQHWTGYVESSNRRPPMTLRINQNHCSVDEYLNQLNQLSINAEASSLVNTGIVLSQPVSVELLPGFDEGKVSVQDAGAQLAAQLLSPLSGERVLDACAAPGGKTGHLLELQPDVILTALDSDADRCRKIEENLNRLSVNATIKCRDAKCTEEWWDGHPYDAILLDVPCSATGVIRRHPDIKLLRRNEDIESVVEEQYKLLCALWPLLKPGGRMLYCSCSIITDENNKQIERFLQSQTDAKSITIDANWGLEQKTGRQLLTGMQKADGFFYALLRKRPN